MGDLGELIPVLNVSTVSKIIDRSPALIPWAAKVAIEKLLRTIPTVELPGPVPVLGIPQMTFEAFSKIAMDAKSAHKDKLEEAGEIGKIAHDWIEKYIKAVMANDQAMVQGLMTQMCPNPQSTSCALAALAWMTAHNVRWLDTERKVFSKEQDCSGTLDGRCITDSCNDPSCCPVAFKDRQSLCDWKTSNHLHIEFLFQAAAYRGFFLEEFPKETLEDIWVLRLGKEDGEFQPWHVEGEEVEKCFKGFIVCLDLKRRVLALEATMSEQRAKQKVVKKAQRAAEKERKKAEEKERKKAEKAQKKAEREAEKARLKAEAKAERERLKKEKNANRRKADATPEPTEAHQEAPVTHDNPQSDCEPSQATGSATIEEGFAYTPNLEQEVLNTTVPEQREQFAKAMDVVDQKLAVEEEDSPVPVFSIPTED